MPLVASDSELTIAQIAHEYGVTHRTIRFYEDRGLIAPERRGTRRIYHPRDRVRLGLILRGKRLGFSLEEITRIIDMYDEQPGESGQLRYLLAQIEDRRVDLEQRRHDVLAALDELDELERRCRDDLDRLEVSR
jgi:DNA-binding transcriptional MerR regulator